MKGETAMLERFLRFFGSKERFEYTGDLYKDFLRQFGGRSFGNGLFNVFPPEAIAEWTQTVRDAFPWIESSFQIFGYDWLGRIRALAYSPKGIEVVLTFDVGADTVDWIPADFAAWLEREVPDRTNRCLNDKLYRKWVRKTLQPIENTTDCISLKFPLDYSGKMELENMELSDMDVYWTVLTSFRNSREGEDARRQNTPKVLPDQNNLDISSFRDEKDGKVTHMLGLLDDQEWTYEEEHLELLKEKVQIYLHFISSGRVKDLQEKHDRLGQVSQYEINIVFLYAPTRKAKQLLKELQEAAVRWNTSIHYFVQKPD